MGIGVIAVLASGLLLDGSVRTELRAGTAVGGEDPKAAAVSADLEGRASSREAGFVFGFSPSAVLAEHGRLYGRGFAELDLGSVETGQARFRQTLGYGTVDLSPLAPSAGALPPSQPPPGSRFVRVQESGSLLELELAASRRLRMGASGAWLVSGGADEVARESLPLARGPLARAFLEWFAAPLDLLRFEATGQETKYSNGRQATIGTLRAGWRTQPARGSELTLVAGPGIGRATLDGGPATTLLYAVAVADLRTTLTRELSASIGAGVEPLGDALSGEVVERGSARASVTLGRAGQATATAHVLGAITLTSGADTPSSPRSGDRYWQGELSGALPIDPRSSVSAGVRMALFSRPLPGQPSREWAAFVTWVARLPLLR